MTINSTRLRTLSLGCLLILFFYACGAHQPVTYYNLTSMPPEVRTAETSESQGAMAIGVGPVTLPEALSRDQIALRLDAQRLRYDDFHRWSSPLAEDFSEVLLDDLVARLPSHTAVALFPWGGFFQPTHRLVVNVTLFDGALGGEVTLKARWTVTNDTGKETLFSRQSLITVKVAGSQYQDLVTAQSQAVAALSDEIVTAMSAR
jgi:uncharacterized lipoprotein YmbA